MQKKDRVVWVDVEMMQNSNILSKSVNFYRFHCRNFELTVEVVWKAMK